MTQERIRIEEYNLSAGRAIINGETWEAVKVNGTEYAVRPDFIDSVKHRRVVGGEVQRREKGYLALRVDRVDREEGDRIEGIPITGHNSLMSLRSNLQRRRSLEELHVRRLAYRAQQG